MRLPWLPRGERHSPRGAGPRHPRFNSRSRVGSDQGLPPPFHATISFNSRSRVGSDTPAQKASALEEHVSIHAPAGGATYGGSGQWRLQSCFNSRSRGGSDTQSPTRTRARPTFQFTLPRGERQPPEDAGGNGQLFQFTLPRGERRPSFLASGSFVPVSIHAPAGGATYNYLLLFRLGCVSIHAPAGGATCRSDRRAETRTCFNSRSRGGSDLRNPVYYLRKRWFQFTLPRGERPTIPNADKLAWGVSIHAPAGGATHQPQYHQIRTSSFNSRSRGGSDLPKRDTF